MKSLSAEESKKLEIGKQFILVNRGYINTLAPELNGNSEKELCLKKDIRKTSSKKRPQRG
ncbi:MAG: hypothetical protein KC553_09765 [Nitrospina sp.]|nr:hypothetical protein [Nitrospina sp.]